MWRGVGRCRRASRRCTTTSSKFMPLLSLVRADATLNSSLEICQGMYEKCMMAYDPPKWPVRTVASSLLLATSRDTFERTHGSARSRVDFVTNRLRKAVTVQTTRIQSTCIDAISVSPATALRASRRLLELRITSKTSTTSHQTTLLTTNSATPLAPPPLSHHSPPPPLLNNHQNVNVHALQHHPHNQLPNQLNQTNLERMELKSCLYRFKITCSMHILFF